MKKPRNIVWCSSRPDVRNSLTPTICLGCWTVQRYPLLEKILSEITTTFKGTEVIIVEEEDPTKFQEMVIVGIDDGQAEKIQASLKEIVALEKLEDPIFDEYKGVMSWSENLTKSWIYYRRNQIAGHVPIVWIGNGFVKIDTVQGWVVVRVSDLSSYCLADFRGDSPFPDAVILNLGRSEIFLRYPDENEALKMFRLLQGCAFL